MTFPTAGGERGSWRIIKHLGIGPAKLHPQANQGLCMEVSIVMGYPHSWMVYKGNPIKMDDLGLPPSMETPVLLKYINCIIKLVRGSMCKSSALTLDEHREDITCANGYTHYIDVLFPQG